MYRHTGWTKHQGARVCFRSQATGSQKIECGIPSTSDGGETGVLDSILAGRAFFWRWALPRPLLGRDGVLGVAWMGRRPPCGSGMRARHPTAAFTCAGEAPAQHLVEEVSAL